jgi:hypothetical protein
MKIMRLCLFFFTAALMACATAPEDFYQNPGAGSNEALCRAYQNSYYTNYQYAADVYREILRRGLNADACQSLISRQNTEIAVGLLAAGAVAYGISELDNGGGGRWVGGAADVDWDQFQDAYGSYVWRCRDISSGQFVNDSLCAHLAKTDQRWPQK